MKENEVRFGKSIAVVTGGAGFIGAALCARLCDMGFGEVIAIDNLRSGKWSRLDKHVTRIDKDICSMGEAEWAEILSPDTYVFHLAAEKYNSSRSTPEKLISTNVIATERLVRASAHAAVARLFFASSLYAYGSMGPKIMRESDVPRGLTLYGTSKLFGEHNLQIYERSHGLRWNCARLFFIYGPNQYADGGYKSVIQTNFERILGGRKAQIRGAGEQELDYVYIDDCIDAIIKMISSEVTGCVVNVSSGVGQSILSLTAKMCSIANSSIEPEFVSPDWTRGSRRIGSNELIRDNFGWSPSTNFDDGLTRVFEWMKNSDE